MSPLMFSSPPAFRVASVARNVYDGSGWGAMEEIHVGQHILLKPSYRLHRLSLSPRGGAFACVCRRARARNGCLVQVCARALFWSTPQKDYHACLPACLPLPPCALPYFPLGCREQLYCCEHHTTHCTQLLKLGNRSRRVGGDCHP